MCFVAVVPLASTIIAHILVLVRLLPLITELVHFVLLSEPFLVVLVAASLCLFLIPLIYSWSLAISKIFMVRVIIIWSFVILWFFIVVLVVGVVSNATLVPLEISGLVVSILVLVVVRILLIVAFVIWFTSKVLL